MKRICSVLVSSVLLLTCMLGGFTPAEAWSKDYSCRDSREAPREPRGPAPDSSRRRPGLQHDDGQARERVHRGGLLPLIAFCAVANIIESAREEREEKETAWVVVNHPVCYGTIIPGGLNVEIPNSDGTYTEVKLTKTEGGYNGPQGEFYKGNPTVKQLKILYGE